MLVFALLTQLAKRAIRCGTIKTLQMIVGLLLLLLPMVAFADETVAPKTVLVLYEETRALAAVAETDDAIRSTLQAGSTQPIRLYEEYLGLSWFPEEARELALRDLLQTTYAVRRPDVVIVWGTGALSFVQRHRAAMFEGIPVVFCAVDPALLPPLEASSAITGVSRRIDWVSSLDLIRRLHPKTREVAIVTGSGALDVRWEDEARRALAGYPGEVTVTYLARQPMPELLKAVESLSPGTVILYGAVLRDSAGRPYLPHEVLVRLSKVSRVPIYAVTPVMLGRGAVGGRILDFASQGVTAAQLALRILNGERLGPADIVEADSPYVFDWHQLRRWGIDESRLPAGSIVRFREASVWDLYKGHITAAVVVIATQSVLIAMLLVQRARRQRAEDQARARREELAHAQRVATMGELSASLAHEITQPLTAIATNAQAARRMLATSAADGELNEALGDIAGDAERAGSIVRRVRAMVRKQPGERQPVDINATVTGVTTILRRDMAQADISLQLRLAEDLPRVLGDAVQLQQVVLNLVVNAYQAMADVADGPRVLRIETAAPKPGSIEITVADTGAGVDGPELERMFKPFVSSKPEGLGMGLSINRSIVEAHGGHIVATRNRDRGLTLRVTLPTMRNEHASTRGSSSESLSSVEAPGQTG
jgi:signal transduction histidine kinase